jgi:NADPH:quinone reductase-like Zn-dependent oxidoreductase
MKAAVFKEYGNPEVVHLEEIDVPKIKPNQLLIKVHTSSVNSADARLRRADPFIVRLLYGLFKPKHKVLGVVFAGEIVEVGEKVTKFKVGQKLYGLNDNFLGGHAQYIAINEDNPMGIIPENMSYEDAAALPFGATTALSFLEGIDLDKKTVLLNGASSAVGTNLLQIASNQGAVVTAITSTKNIELVKSLGAKEIIDYTQNDLNKITQEYDIVIDCINNLGMEGVNRLVKSGGIVILISGMIKEMIFAKQKIKKAKVIVGTAKVTSKQYETINKMYSEGTLKPIIHIVLPLESIVEAHKIVDRWRKVGSVVIKIA